MSRHNKQRRKRKRLTKDRRDNVEENLSTIRRLATPGHLVVAVVDSSALLAKRSGSDEAEERFQDFCAAREEHSVRWLSIPWEETDKAFANGEQWESFKALAKHKGSDYIPACCINRKDGVGIGYCFALVPREAEIAENSQEILVTPNERQDK